MRHIVSNIIYAPKKLKDEHIIIEVETKPKKVVSKICPDILESLNTDSNKKNSDIKMYPKIDNT